MNKKQVALVAGIFFVLFILISINKSKLTGNSKKQDELSFKQSPILTKNIMNISSSAFENNSEIPEKYTCSGENINPPLIFYDIPDSAKSLALIVTDPDAPSGDFTHWILWNINPQTSELKENSIPEGANQGYTDFNDNKYSGPCPPSGEHRYIFKIYALNNTLSIPINSTKEDLQNAMKEHVLSESELTGTYRK